MAKGNSVAAAILATGGKNPALMTQLAQQGQFDVNQPYKQLARPAGQFTQGQFAPGAPMLPAPVDAPGDSERPDPRRTQYPVNWNAPHGQPGSEGLKLAPFATLRAAADVYSVARSCVDHRVNEIVSMGWDIVPTAEATQAMKGDPDLREDWERRRRQVVEFFSSPDSDKAKYPTFESWLSALLEERFVIDAVAIHLRPPRRRGAGPFGSNLAALDLLDGSTIRPLFDLHGATPSGGSVAYQQYLYGVPRVDLISVIMGDDLEELGEPVTAFRGDQLIYLREDTRVVTPYGFSCVEKAIRPITIGLYRQVFQEDYFQEGSVPASFVMAGDGVDTPQQIRMLQDALNAMAGDIGAKHRIVVLPKGSKVEPQKNAPLADQFDEWIISQVTMPFMMTPMDLGVTPRVSAVQSPSESKQISQINTDKGSQNRVKPVTGQLKAELFDFVIKNVFGQKDMEWFWGIPSETDAGSDIIDTHVTQVKNALESIDEARVALGKNPFGLPETSVPGIITSTGYMPLTVAVQAAIASVAGAAGAAAPAPLADENDAPDTETQTGQPDKPQPVLTTPAHDAVRAASGTPPAAKSVTAELEKLERYLRKGRPASAFSSDILTSDELAEADLPKA